MSEFIAYRFHVYLYLREGDDSLLCHGAFSEVSGLEASMTPKAYKEGGRNWGEVQLAGPATFPPIVLKRGITDDLGFWDWRQMVVDGNVSGARKNCSITMLSRDGKPVVTWNLVNAWPSKVSALSISSDSNDFTIEELTLTHEGINRDGKAAGAQRPS